MFSYPRNGNLKLVVAVLIWWTAYSLMFASQAVNMGELTGEAISWSQALQYSFAGWMTWVPFSLIILWTVRRYPIERSPTAFRTVGIHMSGVVLIIVVKAAYIYATNPLFGWYERLPGFVDVLVASVRNNFMTAWTVIGVAHAFVFYERARDRERRIAEMEKSLVSARLDALRAQLNPHFLFNALNSVAEMVHVDIEQADCMLVSLSVLLRDNLKQNEQQIRPLRDEISIVEHYLLIERIRLADRLHISWQLEGDCLDVPVPILILQPLVENAIVHAIARRKSPGWIAIKVKMLAGSLLLSVENSVEPQTSTVMGNGVGLRTISDRLQLLYGERARIVRCDAGSDRYTAEISIPLPQDGAVPIDPSKEIVA